MYRWREQGHGSVRNKMVWSSVFLKLGIGDKVNHIILFVHRLKHVPFLVTDICRHQLIHERVLKTALRQYYHTM